VESLLYAFCFQLSVWPEVPGDIGYGFDNRAWEGISAGLDRGYYAAMEEALAKHVKTRKANGAELHYVSGWHALPKRTASAGSA
jgi:hypothetical protein